MFDKNYDVRGKHATFIRFLNAQSRKIDKDKTAKNAGVFEYAVDVYMIAPLIGVAYTRTAPIDTDSGDSLTIFADQIIRRQSEIDKVYRLVLLSEKSSNFKAEERIDRVFRSDENIVLQTQNLDLFHSYMRGGVEWLYEQITKEATTQDDYLVRLVEMVKLYSDDFSHLEYTESDDLE